MSSSSKHQLRLPPMPLAKETQAGEPRANCKQYASVLPERTQGLISADAAHVLAAEIFDDALTDARIETSEVAHLLNVSESLVRRMRRKDARERVSLVQELRLPLAYHVAKHKVLNRRLGVARFALLDLLEAAGALALVVNE